MSAHDHGAAPAIVPSAPFDGARGAMIGLAAAGLIALALTLVGGLASPRDTLYSYLFAFTYWCGISVAALLLLQIFHASNARWPTALRRLVETMAVSTGIFVLLFIPIALGLKHIFSWTDLASLPHEDAGVVAQKSGYLNQPFFLIRAAIYFAIWLLVGNLLRLWSLRQDGNSDPALTVRQRRLGAGALPIVALAMTFAAFDWLMSLDPVYGSTIWGLYYFAGSFVGALACLIIFSHLLRENGSLGTAVTVEHFHSLGMFLFAFTCFWAYMAYSQGMLNWIANLPHETRFYLLRSVNGWKPVGVALIVFHFIVPFFAMLPRQLKRRPAALSIAAGYMLFMHAVDLYWVVIPPSGRSAIPHWTIFTAFVGIGGLAISFALFRLRGRPLIPLGDPYLEQSLRYQQP